MIPIADILFDINLMEGLPHDMLGYTAMLIAVGLILSTDQLLEFMFGRSSQSVDDEKHLNRLQRSIARIRPSTDRENRKYSPVSSAFQRIAIAGSIAVLILGSLQFYDFARSMTQSQTRIRAFSTNVIIDVDKKAMPNTIESEIDDRRFLWSQTDYDRKDRTRGSDFGQRSDSWDLSIS